MCNIEILLTIVKDTILIPKVLAKSVDNLFVEYIHIGCHAQYFSRFS